MAVEPTNTGDTLQAEAADKKKILGRKAKLPFEEQMVYFEGEWKGNSLVLGKQFSDEGEAKVSSIHSQKPYFEIRAFLGAIKQDGQRQYLDRSPAPAANQASKA